jgi:hypothetical protein
MGGESAEGREMATAYRDLEQKEGDGAVGEDLEKWAVAVVTGSRGGRRGEEGGNEKGN